MPQRCPDAPYEWLTDLRRKWGDSSTRPTHDPEVNRFRLALTGLVALAVVPACWGGIPPRAGLEGIVLRGPTQPVCVVGKPCEGPARVVLVFSQGARPTARVRTGANGRFRIALPAGRYGVRVAGPAYQRIPDPVAVEVPSAGYARVVFRIDSGIR